MKYRKKPIVVEAFILGTDNLPDWFMDQVTDKTVYLYSDQVVNDPFDHERESFCNIVTLDGVMRGNRGDYIIRGIKGEIYPCKSDIFEASYELVEDEK